MMNRAPTLLAALFVSLAVAGCLPLDAALRAVVEHAQALEAHAPPGAMRVSCVPMSAAAQISKH